MQNINDLTINAIRVLSADAIEKAKSGHPGLPLGAAPIGYSIYTHMVFNPKNPAFDNRDRFILSAGHGSMLVYALNYIFGYAITKEDIINFRQLGAKTTGHPEWNVCPGIETSTGPLGQGICNGVGMAMAETILAEKFNREGFPIVDHYTYVLCGDGCMEEGMESEAASLAGNLKLGKLIVFYDSNNITIEGDTGITFTEDVGARHKAMGWQVINVNDANDLNALNKAIKKAKAEREKPSLIICKSKIGYGSDQEGKADCHGAPLGEQSVKNLRERLGYNYPAFEVPEEVFNNGKKYARKGKKAERLWKATFKAYKEQYPELADEYENWKNPDLKSLLDNEDLWKFEKADATRGHGSTVLNKIAKLIPNLYGGSADLAPTNKTTLKGMGDYSAQDRLGRNIHFGIREHAMGAITNGMKLHGVLVPFCSTFAVFSDYMRGAIRTTAIMSLPIPFVFTHDSIGVGEDGPTHQPIEHLSSFRSMPNVNVFRPADGKETAAAWISAMTADKPTLMFLSRQTLPELSGTGRDALKGGYVVCDGNKAIPDAIIIATGSELNLAVKAKEQLDLEGIDVRVVSMPCAEIFDAQPSAYKNKVLPSKVTKRLAVEAGSTDCWYKYVGLDGKVIGMESFGVSAPGNVLFDKFGFTVQNVVDTVKSMM